MYFPPRCELRLRSAPLDLSSHVSLKIIPWTANTPTYNPLDLPDHYLFLSALSEKLILTVCATTSASYLPASLFTRAVIEERHCNIEWVIYRLFAERWLRIVYSLIFPIVRELWGGEAFILCLSVIYFRCCSGALSSAVTFPLRWT